MGARQCYSGLFCGNMPWQGFVVQFCQLKTNGPNVHAASSLVTSSSPTGGTNKSEYSFVLIMVSLLGAATMNSKVVQRRHRGLLQCNQYSEADATATHIEV